MENLNQKIIVNIKQEEKIEDLEVLDQFTSPKIVDNIKHEPERHFVFIMPDDPEPEIDEVREVKITLRKFDRKWRTNKTEMFESYSVCGKCDFAVKSPDKLNQHLKVCKIQKCKKCFLMSKSEKIKKCVYCDLKFDCSNCYLNHINRDHRKGSIWHCTKCDRSTLKESTLRKHFQTHVNKFSCVTCKKNFSEKRCLKNHQQQYRHGIFATKPEIKAECEICLRSFANKTYLSRHERTVHSRILFHCDICGKISKNMVLLRLHMGVHLKVPCPVCQHMLGKSRLNEHVKQHSSSAKFECDVCDKVYFSQQRLTQHKKEKHMIDKVQCDLCSKIFNNKFQLRLHMRLHLKISCQICKKSMRQVDLKDHMIRVHSSGENYLACKIKNCRQKFTSIKELKEHEKIHIGPRIYKCLKCDHQTNNLNEMKSHMKTKSH